MRELRPEELRKEIQHGLDSGEPTPLAIEAIKARGRARLESVRVRLIQAESSGFVTQSAGEIKAEFKDELRRNGK